MKRLLSWVEPIVGSILIIAMWLGVLSLFLDLKP